MKRVLYVGLECPSWNDVELIHCPLIETVPLPFDPEIPTQASHIIVTSKTAARLLPLQNLKDKIFLSVGKATTHALEMGGALKIMTAQEECQEGVISLINSLSLVDPLFFWGHSSLSRSTLKDFLEEKGWPLIELILYETRAKALKRLVDLNEIDEIFFSSPSTVDAFCSFFGSLPKDKVLRSQGTITALAIKERL